MSALTVSGRWAGPPTRSWRLTTATRVFVLALATGQTLSAGTAGASGMILLSLAVLAALACAVELAPLVETVRWTPVVEGVLVAVLVSTTMAPTATLLVYLAVPAVIGGLRHGAVSSLNASLATTLALVGSLVAGQESGHTAARLGLSAPWVVIGAGTGLLAAWLSRSTRALEVAQAPYVAAHRLVSQLHELSRQFSGDLDSRTVAQQMVDDVWRISGTSRTSLSVLSGARTLHHLAHVGVVRPAEDQVSRRCIAERKALHAGRYLVLPLRVGDHVFGAVATYGEDPFDPTTESELQEYLDEQSLRLHTALLFEEVRAVATTEERGRIAREIHDGVAQEIASLGYLIDEIADEIGPEVRPRTDELRREVTRIVGELRLSIFDLRHSVSDVGGLAGALADYAREMGARADLRVHLLIDEQGLQLAPYVELELLRVAQEALANIRKHAEAENLWVSIVNDEGLITLTVEDDGVGSAAPRTGHYGLHNMAERAALIGATFSLRPRTHGGTVVSVTLSSAVPATRPPAKAVDHGNTHPAHR